MALLSSPYSEEGGQAFTSLHFPVWKQTAPLATAPAASPGRDSERESAKPAGSGMSTLALKQGLIGATQQPLSHDGICFLKTSALLRCNLHSIKFGGF